jgi:hypothetical protein
MSNLEKVLVSQIEGTKNILQDEIESCRKYGVRYLTNEREKFGWSGSGAATD